MNQPIEHPLTWRTDTDPYRGPVCVWCRRGIRECGADAYAPCGKRIAYWANMAVTQPGDPASRDPFHSDPADPT
jgi:hypothetical protein